MQQCRVSALGRSRGTGDFPRIQFETFPLSLFSLSLSLGCSNGNLFSLSPNLSNKLLHSLPFSLLLSLSLPFPNRVVLWKGVEKKETTNDVVAFLQVLVLPL